MDIKELIKEKLNQLSKEELVDVLADVCTIYVSAIGYTNLPASVFVLLLANVSINITLLPNNLAI